MEKKILGQPENFSILQFCQNVDFFSDKTIHKTLQRKPIKDFFLYTIYQNYTLALKP